MTDSVAVFPPGFRITDADGDAISGATVEFYAAGTSTPKTVHSDDDLTVSLGAVVTCDAGGYPANSGTRVQVYVGTPDYKVIIKDSTGATLATHDNVKGALTTPTTVTEAKRKTPVISKTSTYSVVLADWGKLINANPTGGTFSITLPSAVTVGDGFTIGIRHVGTANTVPIVPVLSQTISHSGKAAAAKAIGSYGETFWLVSDGANWHVDSYVPPSMSGRLPLILITDRLTAPPTSPIGGARYILNGTATGTWLAAGYVQHDILEADGNGGWTKYSPTEGMLAYVEDENLYTAFVGTAWSDQTGMATPSTSALKRLVVQNIQSTGADGGSVTHNTVTTATLNAVVTNTITGSSLASNDITLPAGTYDIQAWKSFSGGNANQANTGKIRLYNVTTAAAISNAIGTPATAGSNGSGVPVAGATSSLRTVQTFAVETVIRLQIIAVSSDGTAIGLGEAVGTTSEVYAQVDILDLTSLQGAQGTQGTQGADGLDAAYAYQFSTATSGDPGAGKWRLDNASPASATAIAISETDIVSGALAAVIATWDDSTSTNKARFRAAKQAGEGTFFEAWITGAGTDVGTYWTFPITYIGHNGTMANADPTAVQVVVSGDKGDTGPAGVTGSTSFTFSTTTTDSDPGSGGLRLNHATPASATAAYFDNNNSGGSDVSAWLDTFDDNGNSTLRGTLYLYDAAAAQTAFCIFNVSGSVVDGTGYRKVTIASVSGAGSFTNGNVVIAAFIARGPAGVGSGDLVAANNLSDLASPKTGFDTINVHGADVASATTTNLDSATGVLVDVTGTTTITAITLADGRERVVRFTGALILTHGASLVLPGSANITTAAGDVAVFRGYAAGVVRCVSYQKLTGKAVVTSITASDVSAAVLAAFTFGPFTTIASATTTDLSTVATIGVSISGTTTITGFGTGANLLRIGKFAGILTLTHNATSLILPGGGNITTAAGDTFIALSDGSGNWTVVSYVRATAFPVRIPEVIVIPVGDETTAISTGTAKVTFRMPWAMTVTAVRASLTTASSSGLPTVDINETATTILSTKLTIDANELTSTTAATPAVISDSALADDAEITIDIDVAGTGAKGLKVAIIGYRTA